MQHDNALVAQLHALCGPPARYSEYGVGDHISYRAIPPGAGVKQGVVLYILPACQDTATTQTPLTYLVDSGEGWPDYVYSGDIVEALTP